MIVNDLAGEPLQLRKGLCGDILKLVEHIDRIAGAGALLPTLQKLKLFAADLYQLRFRPSHRAMA